MSPKTHSTASLLSVSSRTPLNGSQRKDFQDAFASLQSTYGFAGSAPCPVPKTSTSTSTSAKSSTRTPSSVNAPLRQTEAKKDFRSAFGALQSTYGFSGAAPCPVLKSNK
ncbi:hypothetical protein R3P38DRAFT_2842482 [Favolaschia claudopus]|uniref:Uncharacterized protein n=1 Tax=Favolaschia claudopus TaxID=2862362 RepID=A0AAW0E432_9AGAR